MHRIEKAKNDDITCAFITGLLVGLVFGLILFIVYVSIRGF